MEMDYLSLAIGFLLGTATGAAGTYLANKYTDQRRRKESEKELSKIFDSLWIKHYDLMLEMKQDLEKPENKFQREFFLIKSKWLLNVGGPYLVYYLNRHQNLEQQIKILESYELVANVTESEKSVLKYRFNEKFVELLENKKI